VIHEVPDQGRLLEELKSILKSDGRIFIVEPKFHVSNKSFEAMVERIKSIGFDEIERPKIFFSRTVLLSLTK
jgi:tRNA A58 N-methylase Trm61